MRKLLVILYSGGQDSRLLLEIAKSIYSSDTTIHCLLFDYGQLMQEELQVARRILTKHQVPYVEVRVDLNALARSALTTGEPSLYNYHWAHVPGRNLVFMSLALSYCESNKEFDSYEIWYGANWEDYEGNFPDCFQVWIGALNDMCKNNGYFKDKSVKIRAPLLGMDKSTISKMCDYFAISKDEFFSGYGSITPGTTTSSQQS